MSATARGCPCECWPVDVKLTLSGCVSLIAHDNGGASDSANVSITVEEVPSSSDLPYRYERTFSNLEFDRPTNMEPGPDGDRFYVTEQTGTIRVVPVDPATPSRTIV